MFDLITRFAEHLQGMMDSPWVWLVVFLVAGLDAVLPFMPSETTVIIVAVLLGSSLPQLALLVAVAAAGALAGDFLGYTIGRTLGPAALTRLRRGARGRRMHDWARVQLHTHATTLLVGGRYIPGVRATTMLTAGALTYPRRPFLLADAFGATMWALYATLIGYAGGAAFADEPGKGLLLGLGLGLVLAVLVEGLRRLIVSSAREPSDTGATPPSP